ncbi:polycystic kidney disease and receptor for egg jelly-related protein [Orycteropus afer afer]|uniref:Polycystin family receptor for egg jelly n=1 Tax=Orycteropus afer afer TaxID=1230840 RepID=A0A8B7B0Y2_ORYAF|nr:polycystic kidney disease and receptor for egg jelly-related protein [Orycteropus afer afer]
MLPGPALLLFLGLGRLPPPSAPRGAQVPGPGPPASLSAFRAPSGDQPGVPAWAEVAEPRRLRGAPGLAMRCSQALLRLRPRAAAAGGVVFSGRRSLYMARRQGAAARPRWYCLGVRVLVRARGGLTAPTDVRLRLAALSGRLSLAWFATLPRPLRHPSWTFHLRLLGPCATRRPRDAATGRQSSASSAGSPAGVGFVAETKCPTDGPTRVILEAVNSYTPKAIESSVSCQLKPCVINQVKVNRNKARSPVRLTWKTEATLNASVDVDCPDALSITQFWQVFSVPSALDVPEWTKPLDVPQLETRINSSFLHIPKASLIWGVYVVNFVVAITTSDPEMPLVKDSDYIYVEVVRSKLKAVILGGPSLTINFTDGLVLDGSMSSDPDADNPLEGLTFFWYCTTNQRNYNGDEIAVLSPHICQPGQTDLHWPWASGPVLTLLPETLKGNQVYFFRMVVQKSDRTTFADRRVYVLQGPVPVTSMSCIENCGRNLMVSDRFSLFLNCTNCAISRIFYKWSVLSPIAHEMPFDWMGQATTGRNGVYLSIKAFAFKQFLEKRYWVSLYLSTWGGVIRTFRHGFVINHGPEIGECSINPAKGIAFVTKFVVACSNFKDKDVPLTYKVIVSDLDGIAEINSLKENTLGAILYLGTQPRTPPSFLPVGVPANHYAVKLYVQVYDSQGAFSQVTLYATVQPPTDEKSPRTVLHQLLSATVGPNSSLSTLLQEQNFLSAGYLIYTVTSVLNSMRTDLPLLDNKASIRTHLLNQSFLLPITTLEEISQVVTIIVELAQKESEFTQDVQKLAIVRLWQANQALQAYRRRETRIRSEQIEIVSTGIFTVLSNILKQMAAQEVVQDPFYVIESLADTILASKVPGSKSTVLTTSNLNMYVKKVEKWDVTSSFTNQQHCRNCFYPTLNESSVPDLPPNAPVSTMFCEFADDPFPWLNYGGNISAEVVGVRMTGAKANGDVIEITPDVVEVYLIRKNLTSTAFNLTMGPNSEPGEVAKPLKKTTGAFRFEVDSGVIKELLVHIVTGVTVLFKVLVFAGSQITPSALVATFLVPHDMPPTANQSDLFDPACSVKEARVVCLPQSLLQAIAQHRRSSKYTVSVVLQAPRFVLTPNDKLVRISLFSVHCLDMYGIQSDWREDNCILGEKTSWLKVHCVCRNKMRARRQLSPIVNLTSIQLHTHFLTAKVIVVPNPVDLQLEVIKNIIQNPVTLFTVLFIMLIYIVLAFWALHRDAMDQFLRHRVIVLPDNDPYDTMCYLVTIFTGSRWGSGTKADVFVQLMGTESTSDVHCLSHPYYTSLYRGSINTFLLTTKSNLGDIHSIRVWHNNEGKTPSWYLSRIKVENLFTRRIWLFMCRKWLSVDTSLDRKFCVTPSDAPLNRTDFFLISTTYELGKSHMWFSVFASVIAKPVSRLQKLSCCLTVLLSSLLCNIMFFNANRKGDTDSKRLYYIRLMMIGIESALITVPVQLLLSFLFTYSQKKPIQMHLEEVAPRKHHPVMSEESGFWDERLRKWYAYETTKPHTREADKLTSTSNPEHPKASRQTTFKTQHKLEEAEAKAPQTRSSRTNSNNNNNNVRYDQDVLPEEPPPQQKSKPKARILLPQWCVYVAWFLVFAICSISSFFIVFYGLTYGYDLSRRWLFTSFCSFFQSVFLVQTFKIILLSGFRTNKPKYCKNLPWTIKCHYIEIRLHGLGKDPAEKHRQHLRIHHIRGTRMYQPLTEDEIRIFKRKKRIKRRALLFLSYILTHFIFLALLLGLVTLLQHTDCFYYNKFICDYFSVDLATVTKLEHIYRWLNNVVLPLFHNDLNPTFLFDSSSKILGLPLMRQVRAKPSEKKCLPDKIIVLNSIQREIHCHPKYGIDPEDTKNYASSWNAVDEQAIGQNPNGFTYKPHEKKWAYYSYGVLHTYGSGGYAFYFFPDQQQFNSTLRLRELQGNNWLDEKTWAVILELTTFNADMNLLCSISVIFEVSQLGVVNSSASVYSFSLADFNRNTSAEIYLYLAILIFFVAYIVDEGYIITQERASYVRSVYNLLNFALKCIFTVLIVLIFRKHLLTTDIIHFYLSHPKKFIPSHAVSQVDHLMRITLGFLLFLTILKTLRYSRVFYDVRLAQRAIQIALPGICHMAFVVSIYFFVYMAFGYLVFGQHEWNYSNLIHATQTVFSYCVSAFQNTEFSSNRVLGVLFLSSFMLIMICILINLFQAVILSAYEEMKQPVYEEPSDEAEAMTYLCRQLRTVFRLLTFQSRSKDEPEFVINMLYGQPEKNNRRYLGLKTRNINGKKMVYLVV